MRHRVWQPAGAHRRGQRAGAGVPAAGHVPVPTHRGGAKGRAHPRFERLAGKRSKRTAALPGGKGNLPVRAGDPAPQPDNAPQADFAGCVRPPPYPGGKRGGVCRGTADPQRGLQRERPH